ncbi:MAG: hypothetical protein HXY40_09190 [Chloroflexi bacterium]|nr:hypothetical protein [Chloroflexota bacterium]
MPKGFKPGALGKRMLNFARARILFYAPDYDFDTPVDYAPPLWQPDTVEPDEGEAAPDNAAPRPLARPVESPPAAREKPLARRPAKPEATSTPTRQPPASPAASPRETAPPIRAARPAAAPQAAPAPPRAVQREPSFNDPQTKKFAPDLLAILAAHERKAAEDSAPPAESQSAVSHTPQTAPQTTSQAVPQPLPQPVPRPSGRYAPAAPQTTPQTTPPPARQSVQRSPQNTPPVPTPAPRYPRPTSPEAPVLRRPAAAPQTAADEPVPQSLPIELPLPPRSKPRLVEEITPPYSAQDTREDVMEAWQQGEWLPGDDDEDTVLIERPPLPAAEDAAPAVSPAATPVTQRQPVESAPTPTPRPQPSSDPDASFEPLETFDTPVEHWPTEAIPAVTFDEPDSHMGVETLPERAQPSSDEPPGVQRAPENAPHSSAPVFSAPSAPAAYDLPTFDDEIDRETEQVDYNAGIMSNYLTPFQRADNSEDLLAVLRHAEAPDTPPQADAQAAAGYAAAEDSDYGNSGDDDEQPHLFAALMDSGIVKSTRSERRATRPSGVQRRRASIERMEEAQHENGAALPVSDENQAAVPAPESAEADLLRLLNLPADTPVAGLRQPPPALQTPPAAPRSVRQEEIEEGDWRPADETNPLRSVRRAPLRRAEAAPAAPEEASASDSDSGEQQNAAADNPQIDKLAREVLRILRGRLRIEQERRSNK